MNLESKIKETLARHEGDVQTRAGAWPEIERRVGRSRKRRIVAGGLGAVMAVAVALVVIPKIGQQPQIQPISPSGWKTIDSKVGGYRLSYPPDWTALEGNGATDITPPGPPTGREGKLTFQVRAAVETARYDAPDTQPEGTRSSGTLNGHRYLRYEFRTSENVTDAIRILYRIDWDGPAATCRSGSPCPQPDYTLVLNLVARNQSVWDQYGPTAERIVRTAVVIPSSAKTFVRPTVQARISVVLDRIVASDQAVWGIAGTPGDGKPGELVRIDPASNRVVARIPVGYVPTDVAAGAGAIWVTNGNACVVVGGCGQGGEGPPPTVPPGMQNSVWRIDEATNKVTAKIDVSAEPTTVTTTADAVWVGGGTKVFRIDPATNKITPIISIKGNVGRMAAGQGGVWVVSAADGEQIEITRIDPTANAVHNSFALASGPDPSDITVGLGFAWVTNAGPGDEKRLVRISLDDAHEVAPSSVSDAAPIGVSGVATGNGFAWVISGRGELTQIDPATNAAVADPVAVGENPPVGAQDLVTGFGSVWVASSDGLWRLSP